MLNKFITAIEPFALTIIILAGASLAGWVTFTNHYVVGVATVACGILLTVNHVYKQLSKDNTTTKTSKKDK
jgi:hypothetical protein